MDPTFGKLEDLAMLTVAPSAINRVQWCPNQEESLFSVCDNHTLHLVDDVSIKVMEKYHFKIRISSSDWNSLDTRMIAVCGSESQVRLVDLRTGSSVHSMTVSAMSRMPTHRATRCIWSKQDTRCLVVGDNEGFVHIFDTRKSLKSLLTSGQHTSQISGMAFTTDQSQIVTSHGIENKLRLWHFKNGNLKRANTKFFNYLADQSLKKSRDRRTLSPDANMKCQFYVTDKHIFCPTSIDQRSDEVWIYEIDSGKLIKTLRSEEILTAGIYSIVGLMNDSISLYVGGRGRLRAWSLDEESEDRLSKLKKYHVDRWESDSD